MLAWRSVLLGALLACVAHGGPLHEAAAAGDTATIRSLLEVPSLEDAASRRQRLLEAKAAHKETPLHVAALRGHVEAIELLLQAGAVLEATTDAKARPREPLQPCLAYSS